MSPARILIVEDEALVSLEISRTVEGLGYQPIGRAADGEKALAMAEEHRPDLALMDIHLMGIMDGIDTAREMRRRFGIPSVFLTAYSEDATLERAKLAEPYGYIIKPFNDRDLKSAIEIALHKHAADQEIQRMNRLFDLLSQVNQTIVYSDSHEELFPVICRAIVERGALDFAWIGRCDPVCSRIEVLSLFGEQLDLRNEAGRAVSIPSESWEAIGETIRDGRSFVCNGCGNGHCLYPPKKSPIRAGRKSCASFPIRFQGEVWGALNVCAPKAGFFQDREIALFNEVAMDVSFALDMIDGNARRRQLEALTIRQNAVLSAINRIFQEALSSHSEEDLGKICLAAAREVTESPLGFLARINRQGEPIADTLAIHPEKGSCKALASDGHYHLFPQIGAGGILEKALNEGKGLLINDSASPSRRMQLPPGHPPLDAFLGVPLRREALNVGLIAMGNREGGYRQEDLEALEALAPAMVEAFSRKEAEAGLRDSEERLRLFIEHAPASLAMFDREMRYLSASRRWMSDYNLGDLQTIGRSHYEIFPEIPEQWKAVHRRGLSGEVVKAENDRFERADGSVQWLCWEVRPWYDSRGDVAGIVIFTEDTTERNNAWEAVRENEAYLRRILQTTADGFWVVDREGKILDVNDAYCRMSGYDHEELTTMRIADVEAVEKPLDIVARMKYITETGTQVFESRHRRKDGSVLDVQLSVNYLEMRGGRYVCFCRDVTERKRGELRLRESEERYRSLVETSFDWIWEIDAQGRYAYASSRVQEILGYSPEELLGRSPFELMPPEEALRVGAIFQGIASERRPFSLLENVNLHRDGRRVVLETSGTPIWGAGGEFIGYRGMDRDVTERKRIEQEKAQAEVQLRQAQKMEAIGHLAGGIAHDFNNILGAVIGYTEIAMDEAQEGGSLAADLKQILSAGLRAKELVKQILTFSRQTERETKPVEITYIVKEAVKMLRATLPSTIAITQRAKLSPQSRALADPTEIHQVIMNLCTNAAHAMRAKGGSLDVEITEVLLRDEEPRPHPDLSPGEYIRLSVVDTGHGMSEEVAAQIFNPFFTTKEKGEGTGMGLSVAHGIVRNCNGAITVESAPGAGAAFRVYLPRITVDAEDSAQDLQEALGGKGRILVVDDEKPIVELAQRMLEKLGYSVTTTTSSREALEIVASNPYWFDLLITDYTMPRMTGLDLANEVKRIRPGMPVIVCSGHNEMVNEKTTATFDIDGFVSKPFERRELSGAIRRALHGE